MYTKYHYIYDIKERLNDYADDSELSIEHLGFLIDEVRALVIKQSYQGIGVNIPNTIKQQINLDLILDQDNIFASLNKILVSENALPKLIESSNQNKYITVDNGSYRNVKFIKSTNERFPYVGGNKFLQNIVYYTLGVDYKLYFTGGSSVHTLMENARVFGVFTNPKEAWEAGPNYNEDIDFNDTIYPIDSDMWVKISDIIFKMLAPKAQIQEDKLNNANDN